MIYMDEYVVDFILSKLIPVQVPHLIAVPRARLLLILLAHWLLIYVLIVASVWLLVLFTIPFLVIVMMHYFTFAKVWKAYRYSLLLLNSFTFIVFCVAIVTGIPIRHFIIEWLF